MNQRLIFERHPSIEWVDQPVVIDTAYTENVELVPTKTAQASVTPIYTENNVDQLFGFAPPAPFAFFEPFKGYNHRLRRLFSRKVLSSFDPDGAISQIDEVFEEGYEDGEGEGEILYEMLHSLKGLNDLLEEIILNILSTIRS